MGPAAWAGPSPAEAELWARGRPVESPFENPYALSEADLAAAQNRGARHAWQWPVNETGLLIPYEAMDRYLEAAEDNPFKRFLVNLAGPIFPFRNFKGLFEWLGLAPERREAAASPYHWPRPEGATEHAFIGAALIRTPYGEGLTFSCGSCHASDFFGRSVPGLTNKRPRSNEFFWRVKRTLPFASPALFKQGLAASDEEVALFRRSQRQIGAVRPIRPLSLGLDTSLAHVGRSLAARADDGWASFQPLREKFPRRHELDEHRADSKPMPWWTLKYKNRWLSDGSVVSGNPILTNLLWNEIGRGTDLRKLEAWLAQNEDVVKDLTTRVFSTPAPRFTDFFPASRVSLERARRGEKLFRANCASCHGHYENAWNEPDASLLSEVEILETTRVRYHRTTPVIDVGTEPDRSSGMGELSRQLNGLELSRRWGVLIEPQKGYVPPPLEGIFARYPYLHNASVPNLCALLEPVRRRPTSFVAGPARDPATDYDFDCVGYPVGSKMPEAWFYDRDAYVDLGVSGRRAMGHERMLFAADGKEKFSADDKRDLIEFLKTL